MNIESFSTLQIEYNSTDDLFTTFESREWKTWEISHIVQNIQNFFIGNLKRLSSSPLTVVGCEKSWLSKSLIWQHFFFQMQRQR